MKRKVLVIAANSYCLWTLSRVRHAQVLPVRDSLYLLSLRAGVALLSFTNEELETERGQSCW